MFSKLIRTFYGDISKGEIKKFATLAVTFLFVIGSYWLLRPLKEGIFFNLVGAKYLPLAKTISVFVVISLVLIYSKLVDMFEKEKLFYVVTGFFALLYLGIALLLGHPEIGLANRAVGPHRWIGWVSYFGIEAFGSIFIAMFWSFCASITSPESAKKGFPMILAGGQLGGITGPFLATHAKTIGVQRLYFMAGLGIVFVMAMFYYFIKTTPKELLVSTGRENKKKPKTGLVEGLKLVLTRPYLFGIFAIVALFEVVITMIDFLMKMQASALPEYSTVESLTAFVGLFGMCTNTLAFLMALLGSSYLMRRFGLTFCLLVFPVTVGIVITGLYITSITPGVSPYTLLWSTFGVMFIAKGLSYALNNPSKETMYIPTSKDAKFKSKSWIDAFGARTAKASGAQIVGNLPQGISMLMVYATTVSLGLVGFWILAALFVGRKFSKLTAKGEIVE